MNQRWRISFFAATAFSAFTALAAPNTEPTPLLGWQLTAPSIDRFEASRDQNVTFRGQPTARLQASVETADLGSLHHSIAAEEYREKRIRFATNAKIKGVQGWTGVWLRIESIDVPFLAYADTHAVDLRGDSDWTALTIVIDVPKNARAVHLGLAQVGPGTSWFGPVSVETVDRSVPLSYNAASRNFATEPLACSRAAPTGSHIPETACYNLRTGRTSYYAIPEYVRGAVLSGTRVGIPRGWLWTWG
jgi:hypothetical protein